jgi:hypothetical protein
MTFLPSPKRLAIIGAIPITFFAVLSLSAELPRFVDPCFVWADKSGSVTPDMVLCRGRVGGTSETKSRTILRLLVVQGTMLVASALAITGAYQSRPRYIFEAFLVTLLLSVPLMIGNFGLITLISAFCLSHYQPKRGCRPDARRI